MSKSEAEAVAKTKDLILDSINRNQNGDYYIILECLMSQEGCMVRVKVMLTNFLSLEFHKIS